MPSLLSVLLFLGANYLIGYDLGGALTRSPAIRAALVAVMPCLTMLLLALAGGGAVRRGALPDER